MSPAHDAQRPPGVGPAAEHAITDLADRQAQQYRHRADHCVTCSGVQHRDVIADQWWNWAAGYRRAA